MGKLDGVLLLEEISILIELLFFLYGLWLLIAQHTLPWLLRIVLTLLADDVDHHFFVELFLTREL